MIPDQQPLYKWLDGTMSTHGGAGRWRKNRWRSVRGALVPCQNGLHLCRVEHLVSWIAPSLWLAEYDGELVDAGDKVVVRRARVTEKLAWGKRAARLFAADCAERVLPLFEAEYPHDDRPRRAIETARLFARDEIDAAAYAAYAAARSAARSAAYAAADAAYSAAYAAAYSAADSAAYAAAYSAADSAADSAAGAARWAEREWQTARLLDYAHGRLS